MFATKRTRSARQLVAARWNAATASREGRGDVEGEGPQGVERGTDADSNRVRD